ncbi:nickel pincer cofactor biosynthesis protein LarC [Candidatus Aerophobetes bacterium]|uniref:Putative nickel insertion protein n=1 Tax=Aerophobetes bacterium TaxID=2030807 RepID=A0A662DGW4_UNCAE|nr:MAG: nickel pincer cofactor biosynthesis protein LarC [Candidatus Aerophobetes bacterium]
MKIAYFDCFSGISGDMILGALVDAGLPLEVFTKLIDDLNLSGCRISSKKVKKSGISATKVDISFPPIRKSPAEILSLMESLDISQKLKEKSKSIFLTLAKAEAYIHQEDINSVHLHELGSIDTLIDIVGSVVGLDKMGIEEVYSSEINVGEGFVKTAHGYLPVPAPATAHILKGVPVYSSGVKAELTTPTGAAILTGFSSGYGSLPLMKLEIIGYGAGEKDLPSPNLLRVLIGEKSIQSEQEDWVSVLETNIDDMNPEFYDYLIDFLLKKGALDVFLTPIQMKKSRPGMLLSVICYEKKQKEIIDTIFSETSTFGIRVSRLRREKLKREIKNLKTSLGNIRVKLGILDGKIVSVSPEYEDCKKIALERKIPLKRVYELVKMEAGSLITKRYA